MTLWKNKFLDRYNPQRIFEKALTSGINAAVQHNSLYRSDITLEEKKVVRLEWCKILQSLVKKYENKQSKEQYEEDIEMMKSLMNKSCSQFFRTDRHSRFNSDPGFRISHAQKSLGVGLKHLWCMNRVATPPQCPIDSIILKKAGKQYPDAKWGYVNSIEEHRNKIMFLMVAKETGNQSLACWELQKFEVIH